MDIRLASALNSDFEKAKSRARVSKVVSFLTAKNDDLLSFEEITGMVKPASQSYAGIKNVPLDRVVGSEGRNEDFNRSFLPRKEFLRYRWMKVDEAQYEDKILPPVKLYELGSLYFVKDGNHRISVAKLRRREFIDAEVTHLTSDVDLKPGMTMRHIESAIEECKKSVRN